MLILNKPACQALQQINIQCPGHSLSSFLAVTGGRDEFSFDPQRMQDGQHLAKLASGLPFLHINDEPQARAGGHRQILLGHTHCFAGVLDQLAYGFWCMFHGSYLYVTVR